MKRVFLFAVAVLMTLMVKAQGGIENLTYGAKAGWNVTNVGNLDHSKNKMSIHIGAFAEWEMGDFWSIQPELVYSRQGLRVKVDEGKAKSRLNYLNIPVLVKLYVLEDLSIDLGPQFGFALNGKDKWKDDGKPYTQKIKHLNTFELGFAIGASYHVDNFIFSARYNLGLSNAYEKNWVGGNNKNHVFQLSVGYRLNGLF